VCVQVPRCYWPKTSQQVSLNGALVGVLLGQSASPSFVCLSSPRTINLGFLIEGKTLLLYSSHLPLGVPNGLVIYHASSSFSGTVAGEEVEDFCEGSRQFSRKSSAAPPPPSMNFGGQKSLFRHPAKTGKCPRSHLHRSPSPSPPSPSTSPPSPSTLLSPIDEVLTRQCPCLRAFDLGSVLGRLADSTASDRNRGCTRIYPGSAPRRVKTYILLV
jgi:hypothetical protein